MEINFIPTDNGKYRFEVEGDANATAYLLKNTRRKVIAKEGISYAEPALTRLLESYNPNINYRVKEENLCTTLLHKCMDEFREPFTSEVIEVSGGGLNPTVKVKITLPGGASYIGIGRNKNIARQNAALFALNDF